MSRTRHKRKQGEFELRVLRDGRLVMIAPDEALLEIARTFQEKADPREQHVENSDAEATRAGSQ